MSAAVLIHSLKAGDRSHGMRRLTVQQFVLIESSQGALLSHESFVIIELNLTPEALRIEVNP